MDGYQILKLGSITNPIRTKTPIGVNLSNKPIFLIACINDDGVQTTSVTGVLLPVNELIDSPGLLNELTFVGVVCGDKPMQITLTGSTGITIQ